MSAATIDRYLKATKATDQIKGVSTTKPSPLLRSAIKVRKAGDEVEAKPGVLRGRHRGALRTDVEGRVRSHPEPHRCPHRLGVHPQRAEQRPRPHPLGVEGRRGRGAVRGDRAGLRQRQRVPNHAVIKWAADLEIFFTRSRPYKKNDQATVESKNNHLVRKYGFYYRFDTAEGRAVLNRLWRLVNDRLNYLTPTKKPTGYGSDRSGRRTRIYDKPATPLDRLLTAEVLAPKQSAELLAYRDSLNPAAIGREIADLQSALLKLAKDKTEQLYLATFPSALPDVHKGVRILKTKAS
jgi:ribosomal protein L34